ncbi:putative G-patch domain protein [Xylariaceae sp. FL1651]|nr:putative G-patch domain protein [Xylariaceae sp. FL1651]
MAEDEDDDYMNMTFGEEPKAVETSLQRRQRLKREGEIKGRVKSKAELEAEEREAREAALSTSMLESAQAKKSKGLAMMAKMGFKKGGALGSAENSSPADARRLEPIRPEVKDDRGGIGLDSDRKRKLHEAAEGAEKKAKVDENAFRERVRREREVARWERQVYAAMKVCERMDEERQIVSASAAGEGDGDLDGDTPENKEEKEEKKRTLSTRPLKSIPVVWRGLIRKREEAERDRRMKHDLEQSFTVRLPTYEDDLEDEDDLKAMGKTQITYAQVEDLDEEDPELDEFNALEADERLRRLVEYLRNEHKYCFWCKFAYPDDAMEGCPGLTEEDHD